MFLRASALRGSPPGDKVPALPAEMKPPSPELYFLHNDCDFRTFRTHSFFKDNSSIIRYLDVRMLVRLHVVLLLGGQESQTPPVCAEVGQGLRPRHIPPRS